MLEIKNIKLKLGKFCLRNVNINIKAGEYFVILGPSGAGKTVLLETIAGQGFTYLIKEVYIIIKEIFSSFLPKKGMWGLCIKTMNFFLT